MKLFRRHPKEDEVVEPQQPVTPKENKVNRKPVKANNKTQMANLPRNKSPRRVNKQQRLTDEEILGDEMAYNEDDESLRLYSAINPND
jgi:hypothetical protein